MSQRKYIGAEIMEKYYNLSNKKKVEVLENALGLMESNNSQTCDQAIIRSMGYRPQSGYWTKKQTTGS